MLNIQVIEAKLVTCWPGFPLAITASRHLVPPVIYTSARNEIGDHVGNSTLGFCLTQNRSRVMAHHQCGAATSRLMAKLYGCAHTVAHAASIGASIGATPFEILLPVVFGFNCL